MSPIIHYFALHKFVSPFLFCILLLLLFCILSLSKQELRINTNSIIILSKKLKLPPILRYFFAFQKFVIPFFLLLLLLILIAEASKIKSAFAQLD